MSKTNPMDSLYYTGTPAGDVISGMTNGYKWSMAPKQGRLGNIYWLVRVDHLSGFALTRKGAERERDALLARLPQAKEEAA